MQKYTHSLLLIPVSVFFLSQQSHARLNTLTGGLAVGYDYDETVYKNNNPTAPANRYLKQFTIAPLLIIETTGTVDGLTVRFNPEFAYDQETYDNNIFYDFALDAHRNFTRNLRIELTENYIYSDDPEQLTAVSSSDYNQGRRLYWTNNLGVRSIYDYGTESSFEAGYTYRILRNDDTGPGGYEDYDRHIADVALLHQINAAWNFDITASYTRGLFDPPELEAGTATGISSDLAEYRAELTVNWLASSRNTLFTSYSYIESDYDESQRSDSVIHGLTLGDRYQYSRRLSLEAGAGPTYEKTESFDANWDYNAHASLDYDIGEHTTMGLTGEKGYDHQNFSADTTRRGSNQGLTEFWDYRLDLSHEMTADLTFDIFASYRDERQESVVYGVASITASGATVTATDNETLRQESIYSRDIYLAGGTLSYSFMRWYTAALEYTYRNQDSELINDSYDEHRVLLTLSFEKELLRW